MKHSRFFILIHRAARLGTLCWGLMLVSSGLGAMAQMGDGPQEGGGLRGNFGNLRRGGFSGGMQQPAPLPFDGWLQLDRELQGTQRKFDDIEQQQQRVIDALAREKEGYQPGATDPATLLKRQTINRLMGDAHTLTEESRANAAKAGQLLANSIQLRNQWRQILDRNAPAFNDAQTSATRGRWLEASRAFETGGVYEFGVALLGGAFGPLAVQAMPVDVEPGEATMGVNPFENERDGRGGPDDGRRGGPRGRGPRDARMLWQERLGRLEDRANTMRRELNQLQREINQFRTLLGGPVNAPGNQPAQGGE